MSDSALILLAGHWLGFRSYEVVRQRPFLRLHGHLTTQKCPEQELERVKRSHNSSNLDFTILISCM
jgi:hypothetical protein